MTSYTGSRASGPPLADIIREEQAEADSRRLSFGDLFFLAAGGVIGSGWLLSGVQVQADAPGLQAVWCWLIGGGLTLVVAVVMVELGVKRPRTGGLTFLPFRVSGPYLALVIGAGVWAFYAVNPASEMAAVIRGIQGWTHWPWLLAGPERLTWAGTGCAWLLLLPVTAVNLSGSKRFLLINRVLTGFKIAVPLALVLLAIHVELSPAYHSWNLGHNPPSRCVLEQKPGGVISIFRTVTQGSVFYAYLGFQGPLDLAGSIKRRGRHEKGNYAAVRLRRAVYGTVAGSIILYAALQGIIIWLRNRGYLLNSCSSPYVTFVHLVLPGRLADLANVVLHLDMVISPAGTAMVFTYFLTREVAQLSRVGLTHAGLWKPKFSRIARSAGSGKFTDVYWLILVIDFLLSGLALVIFAGNWTALGTVTSVLALIVYATPCVVLAALKGENQPSGWLQVIAGLAFVSLSVIYFLAGWGRLWPGMATWTVGCITLLALPWAAAGARWYDAEPLNPLEGQQSAWKTAVALFALFASLTVLSLLNSYAIIAGLAVVGAFAAFWLMVGWSSHYMGEAKFSTSNSRKRLKSPPPPRLLH